MILAPAQLPCQSTSTMTMTDEPMPTTDQSTVTGNDSVIESVHTQNNSMEVTFCELSEPGATSTPNVYVFKAKALPVQSTPRKRTPVLSSIRARRVDELTPRKKILYKELTAKKKMVQQLRSKCKKMRYHLRSFGISNKSELGISFDKHFSKAGKTLFSSQIKNASKKAKGRRWSVQDKALCLAIYKRSPACYRLLQNILALPSRTTLTRSLNCIPISTGINDALFKHLKERVEMFSEAKKFCSLIFDEVSLSEGLHYNESLDKIEGFEDFGHLGRTDKIANHALVFLVRGLVVKWKQPVAFYFCRDTTPTDKLKILIKEVINALQMAGLRVVATVCDQGSTNQAAIKALVAETRTERPGPFFEVNGEQIFTICDPPHLLKNTRTALRKYNCFFEPGKMAKWSDLVHLYNAEQRKMFRNCTKLTKAHICPDGYKAMRVNLAAQAMSHTVAGGISSLIRSREEYERSLAENEFSPFLLEDSRDTCFFVTLVDNLFDSFNGNSVFPKANKPLRCCLSNKTAHLDFWTEVIGKVSKWRFETANGKPVQHRLQDGWVTSIRAVQLLWKMLSEEGIQRLSLRNLNQDPIENLFCIIRQQGGQNTNPTPSQFISAMKASIVNNFVSSKDKKKSKNCEDDNDDLLSDLRSFIAPGIESKVGTTDSLNDSLCGVSEIDTGSIPGTSHSESFAPQSQPCVYRRVAFTQNERNDASYTAGYISSKILSKPPCPSCLKSIIHPDPKNLLPEHDFIKSKENSSDSRRLTYPSRFMICKVCMVTSVVYPKIKRIASKDNILKLLVADVSRVVDLTGIGCAMHCTSLHADMVILVSRMWLHHYCKRRMQDLRSGAEQGHSRKQPSRFVSALKKMRKILHK